jgi:hypothetical protein
MNLITPLNQNFNGDGSGDCGGSCCGSCDHDDSCDDDHRFVIRFVVHFHPAGAWSRDDDDGDGRRLNYLKNSLDDLFGYYIIP